MNKWPENDIQQRYPSRRWLLKRIAHGLPLYSSAVSTAISWVFESGMWEALYNFIGQTQDTLSDTSIIDSIVSRELSVPGGMPMTFIWISHVPNQASQIWEKIDQIVEGQYFDVVLTEGNLEVFLPLGLRERAIDVDRSPEADDIISLISVINLAICYKLHIKSDREKFINRRLALMYFLTCYNLVPPSDTINLSIEMILWEDKIPPFFGLDYIEDARSLFMLQECIRYTREWKKVLFLSGRGHTEDAEWYCDHPDLLEIKGWINWLIYRWLHDAGR